MANQSIGDLPQRGNSSRIRVKSREQLSAVWARLELIVFEYQRSNGNWQTQTREVYHRGHGAAILLYDLARKTIVLTRQFRYPAWSLGGDGFLYEVPAGIIEANDPEHTIRAETEQETGFVIGTPRFLFKAFASPGSITEQLYYFSAPYDSGARSGMGGGLVEEGEDIEVLEISLDQAVEWVANGAIMDAKTIVLVQYAQLHIFGNPTPGEITE